MGGWEMGGRKVEKISRRLVVGGFPGFRVFRVIVLEEQLFLRKFDLEDAFQTSLVRQDSQKHEMFSTF